MNDPLLERLRAAATTPPPVDVADLHRRARRPTGPLVGLGLVMVLGVVGLVAALVQVPDDQADVRLGPAAPPPGDEHVETTSTDQDEEARAEARAAEAEAVEASQRLRDQCGERVPPPGFQPPTTSVHDPTRVLGPSDATPMRSTPIPLQDVAAPTGWEPHLRTQRLFRTAAPLTFVDRIDGPAQGRCAILLMAAAQPGARLAVLGGDVVAITNEVGDVWWTVADDILLHLVSQGSGDPEVLLDIARQVRTTEAPAVEIPLPDDLGLALRGDGVLDILTADGRRTVHHDQAFAPGDEPHSMSLVGTSLVTYGGDTYAMTPDTDPVVIGRSTYYLPAPDGTGVWLVSGGASTATADIVTLVDAAGSVRSGPHRLPDGFLPDHAIGDGLLVRGTGRAWWTPADGAQPVDVGEFLLAATADRFATCHNSCTGLEVHTVPDDLIAAPLVDRPLIAHGAAFSADGQHLAVPVGHREEDVDVLVVDLERASSSIIELDLAGTVHLAFGPDGQLLAVGDDRVVVVDGQDSGYVRLPDDIALVKDVAVMPRDLADAYLAGS